MKGRTKKEALKELEEQGLAEDKIKELLPYKIFPGNKPTNTILFYTLDPKTLGSIIAMYEHKIFVQGVIWNINSFDQWGVELGKALAKTVKQELDSGADVSVHDASTAGILNYYREVSAD